MFGQQLRTRGDLAAGVCHKARCADILGKLVVAILLVSASHQITVLRA
jgi:hypothetical protein